MGRSEAKKKTVGVFLLGIGVVHVSPNDVAKVMAAHAGDKSEKPVEKELPPVHLPKGVRRLNESPSAEREEWDRLHRNRPRKPKN